MFMGRSNASATLDRLDLLLDQQLTLFMTCVKSTNTTPRRSGACDSTVLDTAKHWTETIRQHRSMRLNCSKPKCR